VLELRRKDNGKPVWIQWWSRPHPSRDYTRTMFIDITERVLMERDKSRLEAQNNYLRQESSLTRASAHRGPLRPAAEVLQQIELVAPTEANVLVFGESGTGKELVARAVHERSPRRQRPLIKVNCGAIPESLFESEMFGHVKGAFTGAVKDRIGRFELADGGRCSSMKWARFRWTSGQAAARGPGTAIRACRRGTHSQRQRPYRGGDESRFAKGS